MLLAPNRRRTRRRTSSVKRGVSSKDYCSHIKLDGWKNAYLRQIPIFIPFEERDSRSPDKLKVDLDPSELSGLGVPGGMALYGQALGHSLLLGVPHENARHRPLLLCESENWANEVLVDPGARAGIAAQASRGRRDQQVLNRAPAGREVLLVNDFVLIAHHGNDDDD